VLSADAMRITPALVLSVLCLAGPALTTVIGSVLAVLQVALSVEFMIAGLRALGVLAG